MTNAAPYEQDGPIVRQYEINGTHVTVTSQPIGQRNHRPQQSYNPIEDWDNPYAEQEPAIEQFEYDEPATVVQEVESSGERTWRVGEQAMRGSLSLAKRIASTKAARTLLIVSFWSGVSGTVGCTLVEAVHDLPVIGKAVPDVGNRAFALPVSAQAMEHDVVTPFKNAFAIEQAAGTLLKRMID